MMAAFLADASTQPASAPATSPAVAPAADPQADLKVVRDVYGPQLKAVKATPEPDDDVALARQLMTAADDPSSTAGLRAALSRTVLDLTVPLGTDASHDLALQAIGALESLQPMRPVAKATLRRDLSVARLNYAIAAKRTSLLQNLAVQSIEAYADFIDAARLDASRIDEIEAAVKAAQPLIFRFQLRKLTNACDAIEATYKWYQARKLAFQGGELRMATAVKSGDEKTIMMAHLVLADLCLEHDGDLISAAKHLIRTDDPRKGAVVAAAAFLTDARSPEAEPKLETVEGLLGIAGTLHGDAQRRVADVGLQICQAYLGDTAAQSVPTKPRLLMMQLEKLSGLTADVRLAKRLAANYGGFRGKLELLEKQQTRCTYDFGFSRQLEDFSGQSNLWVARMDVLGVKTATQAALTNKLRFHANQPFKAMVKVQGSQNLGMRLNFISCGEAISTSTYRLTHAIPTGRSAYYPQWTAHVERGRGEPREVALPRSFRHRADSAYHMRITWDGVNALSWTVRLGPTNMVSYTGQVDLLDRNSTFLQIGLEAKGSTSYYDDLVIEGKVVEDPQREIVPHPPAVPSEDAPRRPKHSYHGEDTPRPPAKPATPAPAPGHPAPAKPAPARPAPIQPVRPAPAPADPAPSAEEIKPPVRENE